VVTSPSPEVGLLAVADALRAVADAADGELALRAEHLCWLCSSLLAPDLEFRARADAGRPVRALLLEAEAELRRYPIGAYPAGTIDVVVGLCDLLREYEGSST
jgi:hypothetical protein